MDLVEEPSLYEELRSDAWSVTTDAGSAEGRIINYIRRQEVRSLIINGTGGERLSYLLRPEDRKDIARFIGVAIVLALEDRKDRNHPTCLAIEDRKDID